MKARRLIIAALAVITAGLLTTAYAVIRPIGMPEENITVIAAPEQSESMVNEAFVAEPYEMIIPSGVNVALEGDAESNGFTNPYSAVKAIDGNVDAASYWEGPADSYPNIFTLELAEQYDIHAVKIRLNPLDIWGRRDMTFSLSISTDGESYTELIGQETYTLDPKAGNELVLEFDPVAARFVQLQFTNNTGASGGQMAELEVYSDQ